MTSPHVSSAVAYDGRPGIWLDETMTPRRVHAATSMCGCTPTWLMMRSLSRRSSSGPRIGVRSRMQRQRLGVAEPLGQRVDVLGVIVPDRDVMARHLAEAARACGSCPGSRRESRCSSCASRGRPSSAGADARTPAGECRHAAASCQSRSAILAAMRGPSRPAASTGGNAARVEPVTNRLRPLDRRLVVDGLGLHLLDWGGDGRTPLLLLHGFTGHAHAWDTLSIALQPHYRVLALDQRGHGDSDPA